MPIPLIFIALYYLQRAEIKKQRFIEIMSSFFAWDKNLDWEVGFLKILSIRVIYSLWQVVHFIRCQFIVPFHRDQPLFDQIIRGQFTRFKGIFSVISLIFVILVICFSESNIILPIFLVQYMKILITVSNNKRNKTTMLPFLKFFNKQQAEISSRKVSK